MLYPAREDIVVSRFDAVSPTTLPTEPVTDAAIGVAAVAAVVTEAFIAAVKSPAVGALVRLVTVVIVPAVILVVLATVPGNVAARKPVGCVYVAIRLEMVASKRLDC